MNTRDSEPKDYMPRRDLRSLIFHLLYAMEAFDYQNSLKSVIENFNKGFELNIPIDGEVFEITNAVVEERTKLDKIIIPFLANWKFERLGCSTKLILRLAVWEIYNKDTDVKVIINEAIELAKCFAEKDSYKFINGILDSIVKEKKD